MFRGSGRRFGIALAVLFLGTIISSGQVSAQVLAVGGHFVANADLDDEFTWGVGGRAHLSLPLTGLALQGTYDFYSPSCGTLECDLNEVGVNVLWNLPVPWLMSPYLGAGMAFQKWDGELDLSTNEGTAFQFLAGLILQGPTFDRFQPFVEFKYQAWDEYENQKVMAGGILMKVF